MYALTALVFLALFGSGVAFADDRGTSSSPERREWFRSQKINPAARQRMNVPFESCCDEGDRFKTRFRVGHAGQDQWEYLDSDGKWKVIPPDIISDKPGFEGEAILFKRQLDGAPLCFYPPTGGL